jgi:predicted RNase H-like HicB family nuclease
MELTAVLSYEDPLWVARCLEVEVTSQGPTESEALANLREALDLYFEDDDADQIIPLQQPHLTRLPLERSA